MTSRRLIPFALLRLVLAGALLLFVTTNGWAAPISFSFNFGASGLLEFTLPGYVTTTGMFNISPTVETIAGITVSQIGTNDLGGWMIGDGNDFIFNGNGGVATGAYIFLAASPSGHITAPGTRTLSVIGQVATSVIGGSLTVADVAAVPEPATLTLLALGLAGIAGHRWRQRKAS